MSLNTSPVSCAHLDFGLFSSGVKAPLTFCSQEKRIPTSRSVTSLILGWPKFWIPTKMWRSVALAHIIMYILVYYPPPKKFQKHGSKSTSQSCPKSRTVCLWRQVIVVSLTLDAFFVEGKDMWSKKGCLNKDQPKDPDFVGIYGNLIEKSC